MKKPILILALLIVPAFLILSGFYFEKKVFKEVFTSIGCVLLIFYIIMALRGKFSNTEKNKQA